MTWTRFFSALKAILEWVERAPTLVHFFGSLTLACLVVLVIRRLFSPAAVDESFLLFLLYTGMTLIVVFGLWLMCYMVGFKIADVSKKINNGECS